MIGKLTGKIDTIGTDNVILDVGGVGYIVACSTPTLARLVVGAPASLLIETRVRDEIMALYGFFDAAERDWFKLLTTVQGVGAKVGLSILSAVPADKLQLAIASGDKASVQRADGVGAKLALRIVTELKDKAGSIGVTFEPIARGNASEPVHNTPTNDAVSALVNLGYARADAYGAVAAAAKKLGDGANLGALIPAALKELSA
ncbi:Holliday junction branch migration protein RuvA [Roseiterribacter gracilis]|uniref:Holliday junction branch migration complex subunit RuvA n=1 Tax=Roseiterribacter gracilis TaxID=2812848 RepID=A0A8S8X8G7_9PROT|nr:Holliday junction ATP-dependent DNA helicase RuvA [Rhodospirillales bacterium TMPK1]